MKLNIALVMAILLGNLSGCISKNFTGVKGKSAIQDRGDYLPFNPRRTVIKGLPDGEDSYSQGFRDGCQTHMGIVGSGTLRLLPERIFPERLINDPVYLRGFNDGADYCWARLDWDGH